MAQLISDATERGIGQRLKDIYYRSVSLHCRQILTTDTSYHNQQIMKWITACTRQLHNTGSGDKLIKLTFYETRRFVVAFTMVSTLSPTSYVTPSSSSLGIPFNVTIPSVTSSSKIVIPSGSPTKIAYASILSPPIYKSNFVILTTLGALYTTNDEGPHHVIFSIVVSLPSS